MRGRSDGRGWLCMMVVMKLGTFFASITLHTLTCLTNIVFHLPHSLRFWFQSENRSTWSVHYTWFFLLLFIIFSFHLFRTCLQSCIFLFFFFLSSFFINDLHSDHSSSSWFRLLLHWHFFSAQSYLRSICQQQSNIFFTQSCSIFRNVWRLWLLVHAGTSITSPSSTNQVGMWRSIHLWLQSVRNWSNFDQQLSRSIQW